MSATECLAKLKKIYYRGDLERAFIAATKGHTTAQDGTEKSRSSFDDSDSSDLKFP